MEFCKECGRLVTPDSFPVTCNNRCEGTYHAACIGLSADDVHDLVWWCCGRSSGKRRKLDPDPPTLPAEIWIEIFEHLPSWQLLKVRLVCHRWKDIVVGSHALKAKFTVRWRSQFIDREYHPVHLFPAAKIFMHRVKIAAVGSWWVPFGVGLTHITLDECKIMLRNLLAILKSSLNLKYLNLYDVTVECHEPNPNPDFQLDKLETLCIDGVSREENLEVFQQICPNIKRLKIVTNYISPNHLLPLLRHLVNFVDGWHSTLEQLEVDGMEVLLIELAQLRQWNLKTLILPGVELENVNSLINFCRLNPALETLRVESTVPYGPDLDQIGQLLPKLTNLMLTFKHSDGIEPTFLTPLAATLRVLKLSSEESELSIVNFTGIRCPNLAALELTLIQLEGSRLQTFLANSPNLRVLSLTYCQFNSWAHVFRAVGTCSKSLRQLTICRATVADSSGDQCFLDYLDEMRHLVLSFCLLQQEHLCTLLRLCPRLEVLHLEGIRNVIDDEIVYVLSKKLPRLEQVTIQNCALSGQAVKAIRQDCHVQQKLEIIEY